MRRIFKVVFYMRGNYVNKEGKSAIMLRITLNGERLTIGTTGITVTPSLWDMKRQRLRGKSTEAMQANHEMDNIKAELQAIANRLEIEDGLCLEAVKTAYLHSGDGVTTIGGLFDVYIENVRMQVGVNVLPTTLEKYQLCKKRFFMMLSQNYKKCDILIRELSPNVVNSFFAYLMEVVGQSHNTATKTLKTFRTVVLHGTKLGLVNTDPFIGIRMHMKPVDRGFLTEEEIDSIMRKKMCSPRLELVRDIFIFSCFTGLAYIDVAALKPENVVTIKGEQWISTHRQKTKTNVTIMLMDIPKQIIAKYEHDKKRKDKLFPIISNQKMNSYLKEIADVCGIKHNLTFHMSRHTFATMALSNGVPLESVSRMLGHMSVHTTQVYARITMKKISEDMRALADKVSGFDEVTEEMLKNT